MRQKHQKTTPEERGYHRFSLRIPPDIKEALDEARADEERSLHEQIMFYIRQGLRARRRQPRARREEEA
jgi:hypothetical protein